jgi:hypothetical protein
MPYKLFEQCARSAKIDREAAIDNVLTYLSIAENRTQDWECLDSNLFEGAGKLVNEFNRVPLNHFDGAEVATLYESCSDTVSYERDILDPEDPELHSLRMGNWDVSTCLYWTDEWLRETYAHIKATYLFSLHRFRMVPMAAVRGLFRLRSSETLEATDAHLFNNGCYAVDRRYYQFLSGQWHTVGIPFGVKPVPLEPGYAKLIWIHKALALTKEYDWEVRIGSNIKTSPTIAVAVDPVSAKDIFKLREVPKGKSRREALRHVKAAISANQRTAASAAPASVAPSPPSTPSVA